MHYIIMLCLPLSSVAAMLTTDSVSDVSTFKWGFWLTIFFAVISGVIVTNVEEYLRGKKVELRGCLWKITVFSSAMLIICLGVEVYIVHHKLEPLVPANLSRYMDGYKAMSLGILTTLVLRPIWQLIKYGNSNKR